MSSTLGIIPAGGSAERFGGVLKELLPCGETTLLERCIGSMNPVCDNILIITTPEKVNAHTRFTKTSGAMFAMARGSLLASLEDAIRLPFDRFVFAMPDTFFPSLALVREYKADFTIGLFTTYTPSRYGVLHEGCIWDKYFDSGEHKAWGTLAWSRKAADHWLDKRDTLRNHTDAFNLMLDEFGCETYELAYYYDCASYDDYRKLVHDV